VCTDASGNVYIAGSFHSSSITFGNITLYGGGLDVYVVKYDPNGTVLWANSAGGWAAGSEALSVSVDGSGNVFVTGYFGVSITFGSITLTNPSFFIVKYDPSGNVLWAKDAIGSGDNQGLSVSADITGNVYVTGFFKSPSIAFGGITLINSDPSGNTNDIFIVKYSASGTVLWAKSAGGSSYDRGNSICSDISGNIYVTGYFGGSITFGSITLTNPSFYIVKYDALGNALWAQQATGSDGGNSVSTDIFGNVFVTGYFVNPTVTFGGFTLTNTGNCNMYVVKYNASGNVLWAKSGGGWNCDKGCSLSSDKWGNVYVVGNASSFPSFSFGSFTLIESSWTIDNAFIVIY
jgi:hypothetical protein